MFVTVLQVHHTRTDVFVGCFFLTSIDLVRYCQGFLGPTCNMIVQQRAHKIVRNPVGQALKRYACFPCVCLYKIDTLNWNLDTRTTLFENANAVDKQGSKPLDCNISR